jgi:anti-sigma regulatory factor (Ser/Thr protein kinase)
LPDRRKRGWGLQIIRSLMDLVEIESGDWGTRIVMRKYK